MILGLASALAGGLVSVGAVALVLVRVWVFAKNLIT